MSTRSQKTQATVAATHQLLDEWLRIEAEHANPGFALPNRAAVVAWSENHPIAVLFCANLAAFAPVFGALTFG